MERRELIPSTGVLGTLSPLGSLQKSVGYEGRLLLGLRKPRPLGAKSGGGLASTGGSGEMGNSNPHMDFF